MRKYYSKEFLKKPETINSKENIEAGRKYFEETEYSTLTLTSSTEKLAYNKYQAKMTVLYANEHVEYDNFVDYIFVFTIKKRGFNEYVFDNVEINKNKVTYIKGDEIHMHDGEVVVCNEEHQNSSDTHQD